MQRLARQDHSSRTGPRCIALKPGGIAEDEHRDIRPAFGKTAGCDVPVAAIVAWTAEHDETAGIRKMSQGRRRHRQSGVAHQREAIDAGLGRCPVDCRHLGGRDQQVLKVGAHAPDLSMPARVKQGLSSATTIALK